jgi:TolB-like protein/class 3 adenylate cyclase/Flp pilus assembly protein TadD
MTSVKTAPLVLFLTDMEGSTRLAQLLGDRYISVLNQHNQIVRTVVQKHNGTIVDNPGDGFFIVFHEPLQALNAAIEIQMALDQHEWPDSFHVRIRIAMHIATIMKTTNSYTGLEINRTSRICEAGFGGQVLLSDAMKTAVKNALPDWISTRALGRFMLRDFDEPIDIHQLVIPGLRVNYPMLRTMSASPTVAVLPFTNLGDDPSQDFLGEGIAEEIIISLGRSPGLRVSARASSFAIKGREFDTQKLGAALNASAILEGSFRSVDGRYQITAELIDVASGTNLWIERFDRKREEVYSIQEEIANKVEESLQVTIVPRQNRSIQATQTRHAEAYEFYLRGHRFYYQYSLRDILFAIQMFRSALELDPEYSLAYCGLADCYTYLYMYKEPSEENLREADQASKKAIELDPFLAEAYASRGQALSILNQYREAENAFKKAIGLDPLLFSAHYQYARLVYAEGNYQKAAWLFQAAQHIRPNDYQSKLLIGVCYDRLGLTEKARLSRERGVKIAEELLKLNPGNTRALYMGANGLVILGEKEKGLEWLQRALALEPEDAMLLYNAGCIYALCDQQEEALNCLEKALENGLTQKAWYIHDGDLDSLRNLPRFQSLMERMK